MFRFICISFFIVAVASAKLPEPSLTLLGGLFQNVEVEGVRGVQSIIPSGENEHFEIVAIREGVGVVAKAQLDSSNDRNIVVLRVPRDDGADPRAADYFSRTGEVVRFEVWYWNDTLNDYSAGANPTRTFDTIVEGDYTLASGFGGVIPRSFTITIPSDDGPFVPPVGADTYEAWLALNNWNWPPDADTGPDGDPDGDGLSNYQEWVLGMDPTDPSDAFDFGATLLVDPVPDLYPETKDAVVYFSPTRIGRTYNVYRRYSMNEDWLLIHSYTPNVDSDESYQYIDVHDQNQDSAFWKVITVINN